MPHYKNGREAREADPVIVETYKNSGIFRAGTLHTIVPGCCSCNAQIAYTVPGGVGNLCITIADAYHAADAFAAIAPKIECSPATCEIPAPS